MIAARLAACLIPLALIAACGRVESAPSSRLVPEWFVGDGGRVPRYVESSLDRGGIADGGTLYDTTLQVSCAVVATADGKLRCIPDEVERLEFGDAACTQPIVSAMNRTPAPYALQYAPCGGVAHVYAVGAPIAPGPAYARQPTECVTSYPEDRKLPRYALKEVPLDQFVAVTEETVPSPNRLQARAWVSEDGLRVPIGAKDTALGAPCSAAWEPRSGESVCLPSRAATDETTEFADVACTRPIVGDRSDNACPMRPIARFDPAGGYGCGPFWYAPIAGPVPATATDYRHDAFGPECKVSRPVPNTPYYETGPALPLAPLTTRLDGPASARLRPYVMDDGHGLALPTGRFRDTAAGFDCIPQRHYEPGPEDGEPPSTVSLLCMPPDFGWSPDDLFTDAACTQPIELAGVGSCAPTPRAVFELIVGSQVAIRPLGAPFTGPLYRVYPKEGCVREEYWGRVGLTPFRVGPPERTLPLAPLTLSR